ncbi:MAG: PTS transporter subunit EIIC [Lachnospiraceae bacterium]|nr:PTS transporter subunit EIIC [Lachnospiraceae bacterium]
MKDKIFGVLQRVGRSFMLPIAILPAAGLLLGFGGSFSNMTTLETYGLTGIMGPGTILNAIFIVMRDAGDIVFANLPLIFAIGVAIGMAKQEKAVAALAAAIAFFIMHASIGALITIRGGAESMLSGAVASVCGITSLQMGVFGGILVGIGVAWLHNRFYKIELPKVLSFFGGTRFVPIISALVYTLVGILMFFIWPVIQSGIYAVGDFVLRSGYFGTWIYGLMERLLIPFGLHHVFYLPFWQTGLGGTMEIDGRLVEGAQNIFFAQLASPNVNRFAVSATRFMSGKFPLMIFGLPGAALAMYRTARLENRKKVGGLLLSAALTSMLTGITEPLEFTFLFVAPLLYGIHCVFAGLAYMLMHVFQVGVGMTFSGGLVDLFLFGILQGNAKTNWIWIVIVGVFYFVAYYLIFYFLIKKMDLKTPGRGEEEEIKLYSRKDMEAKAQKGESDSEKESGAMLLSRNICRGLGGVANISDIDCCATRLRCTVHKAELVDDAFLKDTGASGVIHKGNGVQIIYGPRVTVIKSDLEEYIERFPEGEDVEVRHSDSLEQMSETDGVKKGEQAMFGKRDKKEKTYEEKPKNGCSKVIYADPDAQKERRLTKSVVICSPITGVASELSEVPDEAFSKKIVGDGVAITPADGNIYAPEDGEIVFVYDTKHAIGFLSYTGIPLLLHIGIDTVKLNGQGFEVLVENGQKVKKGELLMRVALSYIQANAPSTMSPVILSEMHENQEIRILKTGKVEAGEELFAVDFYE